MMMMRTAGGPPPVSPLDFSERKTPLFTRTTWIALGVVGAAHIGVGAALLAQQFELAPPVDLPDPPPIIAELYTPPKPPPPKVQPTTEPPAPNTKTNPLPAPPVATETLSIETGDKIAEGTTITTTHTVEEAQPTGAATEPAPPAPPVRLIRNPSWQRQPSAEQMMRAYPDRAIRMGISGTVGLNCLVEASGRVSDCNVARETPAGNGFGRAAQGLSRYFQVNPRTVDGAAEGSRVNITLRFTAPD